MNKKSIISFVALCLLLSTTGFCEESSEAQTINNEIKPINQENKDNLAKNSQELDKGMKIFEKNKKPKKIKVKTKKSKEIKPTQKVLEEYSLPTNVYMPVGEKSDKVVKLEGGISKSIELNMADCIELALINNPKIKSAYAKSEVAKYQKWETLAGYTPRLDWSSSLKHTMPDLSMIKGMRASAFDKYVMGTISIKQLVYDFGYTQNRYTIDKIALERSKTEIDSTVNEVVCAVKDAYYNLAYAYDKRRVATEALDNYTKTYQQALAFWEVGTKTKVDVLFAQTNMEEARADLISANNNIDIAYSRLNNAMGLPFSDPYMIDISLKYEPVEITMKEAVEIANTSRPNLKGAMLSVDEANQGVKLAWKSFLPSLEFEASYSRGGVDSWTDRYWYDIGGYISFPTVNPVLIRNQIKEAKALYQQTQYDVKAQINDIYYEIQDVYTRLKDAKARIPVAKTAMEKAQENYELTSGRYRVGYGDAIELKDAQVALVSAKLAYYQTIYDYNSARANLEKSIGQTLKPITSETIDNSQDI